MQTFSALHLPSSEYLLTEKLQKSLKIILLRENFSRIFYFPIKFIKVINNGGISAQALVMGAEKHTWIFARYSWLILA